eukprot:scaffold1854_cov113-Isochrysis_galbana.AAC.11
MMTVRDGAGTSPARTAGCDSRQNVTAVEGATRTIARRTDWLRWGSRQTRSALQPLPTPRKSTGPSPAATASHAALSSPPPSEQSKLCTSCGDAPQRRGGSSICRISSPDLPEPVASRSRSRVSASGPIMSVSASGGSLSSRSSLAVWLKEPYRIPSAAASSIRR